MVSWLRPLASARVGCVCERGGEEAVCPVFGVAAGVSAKTIGMLG